MRRAGGQRERIAALDVMRGVAILGILLANISFMGQTVGSYADPRLLWSGGADQTAYHVRQLFIDGTQRGLLELLFGATAYIIASKALRPTDAVEVADIYYRRTLWLVLFGVIHGTLLLWPGDILLNYGLAGLALFPLRRLRPRTLLLTGVAGLLIMGAANIPHFLSAERLRSEAAAAASHPRPLPRAEQAKVEAWEADRDRVALPPAQRAAERAMRLGGYAETFAWAWQWEWTFNASDALWLTEFEAFFTMLIGMALFKAGVLQGGRSRPFYGWLALGGYGVGLAIRWYELGQLAAQGYGSLPIQEVVVDVSRLAVTLGHVGLIHLALGTRVGASLLSPFKAAGRMALSCYIGQTLICQWLLFSGFGLALWGRFGLAQLWAIAAAVIALQLLACNLWLRFFAMGPLEWVWRRLTYGRDPRAAMASRPAAATL